MDGIIAGPDPWTVVELLYENPFVVVRFDILEALADTDSRETPNKLEQPQDTRPDSKGRRSWQMRTMRTGEWCFSHSERSGDRGRIRFDNVCDDGVQLAGPMHRVGSLRVSFPCHAPCSLIPTRRAKGQSLPAYV